MRVLVVHNHYQQAGGEDQVYDAETNLLERYGWRVSRYTVTNDAISAKGSLAAAGSALWSRSSYRALRERVRQERPDVMHCHNTLPLISPACYHAAKAEGVAVVQTLHNFRLLCPGAELSRDGRICEDCLGKTVAWPGVMHGCYRGSAAATGVVASMTALHHVLGSWSRKVDRYIALTEFSRRKFIDGGLPGSLIATKPNFVAPDPGPGAGEGGYVLFVGRLTREKGVGLLLEAWKRLTGQFHLKIVGDGPLRSEVAAAAEADSRIEWLGAQERQEVVRQMGAAAALVFPSRCYETFGLVAVEAFATATPVIASGMGAMAELVDDQRTGLLFRPNDSTDLAIKIERLLTHPTLSTEMRRACRREYLENYTAEDNYRRLEAIYGDAIAANRTNSRPV